jgi:hypothetical protein
MEARVEFDGETVECNFIYPFNKPPIIVSGPMGSQGWHNQSYNAKLVLQSIAQLPSEFIVKSGDETYCCALHSQHAFDVFCKIG